MSVVAEREFDRLFPLFSSPHFPYEIIINKGGGARVHSPPLLGPLSLEECPNKTNKERSHTIGDVGGVALSTGAAECGTIESKKKGQYALRYKVSLQAGC